MFGKNPIEKVDQGDGSVLHLVKGSPFRTIQGEGPFAGYPATFVRLHGCNLRCWFCDTQFSDPDDPSYTLDALVKMIIEKTPYDGLVVITGGEPLRQNILPLCRRLATSGRAYTIQIETAGTLWLDDLELYAKVIVSPKTPTLHPKAKMHATAFKYVVAADMDFDRGVPIAATQPGSRARALASPRPGTRVYLSPMDEYDEVKNKANRDKVVEMAMKHDYVAGLQAHKIFGLD